MKFAIFGNTFQSKKSFHALSLFNLLEKYGDEVYINETFYLFLVKELGFQPTISGFIKEDKLEADMIISMGGDGTFLKSASYVGNKDIPIIGINTGRLGFLADISPEEIEEAFEEIHEGNYQIENRTVLEIVSEGNCIKGYPYALNEVAVSKRDTSSMISIHTYVNNAYLTTYQADGLLISTPTGSTAYALSVGGPVMVPHADTIVLTPVAPHSLNIRPIVIPDDSEIRVEVESRSHNFLVAIDGRSERCEQTNKLTIRKAGYSIKVVKRANHTFFETLRNKLMWGIDKRI